MQATLDWSMLVETSLDLLVYVTLDLLMLLSLHGQCRPVSASSEDQSVLVGASLDQLLWMTLESLAQSESLQSILPEAVPAGFTGCSEHSNR